MDLNGARGVLGEMKACFAEANLHIVTENENLNDTFSTDHLKFRSYLAKDSKLIEITALVAPEHEIVHVSLKFRVEVTDSVSAEFMELINIMNFCTWGFYWVKFPAQDSLECRTTFILPSGKIDREHFRKLVNDLLKCGYEQYGYVRRLTEHGEELSAVKSEFLREAVIESKRKRNHNE